MTADNPIAKGSSLFLFLLFLIFSLPCIAWQEFLKGVNREPLLPSFQTIDITPQDLVSVFEKYNLEAFIDELPDVKEKKLSSQGLFIVDYGCSYFVEKGRPINLMFTTPVFSSVRDFTHFVNPVCLTIYEFVAFVFLFCVL